MMMGTRPELKSLYSSVLLYSIIVFLSCNIITLASHLTHSSFTDNCPLPLLKHGFASFPSPLKRELFHSVLFSRRPAEYMIHQTKGSQPDFISLFPNITVSRLCLAQVILGLCSTQTRPQGKKITQMLIICSSKNASEKRRL